MLWPSIKSPLPTFPNPCFSPHLVLVQSPLGGFLKNKKTVKHRNKLYCPQSLISVSEILLQPAAITLSKFSDLRLNEILN